MGCAVRFAAGYAIYVAVVLGYACLLLASPAGALLAPATPTLATLVVASLALPPLDAAGWGVLRPGRAGKALVAVLTAGLAAELAVRGSPPALEVAPIALKLLAYLLVLIAAATLYSAVYAQRQCGGWLPLNAAGE